MHAISSYRGNRLDHKHTQKNHRQDRLQYTAPLSLARSVTIALPVVEKFYDRCVSLLSLEFIDITPQRDRQRVTDGQKSHIIIACQMLHGHDKVTAHLLYTFRSRVLIWSYWTAIRNGRNRSAT